MFSMIVSCSTLRIGPYLFYIEKFITQFKTTEKSNRLNCTHFQENGNLLPWRGSATKKKPPFFNARALMTREIMRSRDTQCVTGNDLKQYLVLHLAPLFKTWIHCHRVNRHSIRPQWECGSCPNQITLIRL